jgi:hypothetical protein
MEEKFSRVKPVFKPLNKDETGLLIAFAALLFGGWIRFYTAFSAGFPINDGGMFYKMTEVILENGFKIPAYFSYNGQNIAFAYPPLAFFNVAGINQLLNIPLLEIFQFLPAIILIATIPAFYMLASTFLGDKVQAGIATFIFALTPRSITWFIMGGGVTRSMGLLLLIIAVKFIYLVYTTPSKKYVYQALIFCVLVVLTHPEAALHTAAIALLLWIYHERTWRGFRRTVILGSGTLVFTVIWWLPLILNIGIDPLLSAAKTGMNGASGFLYPFVHFNDEPYITFIMVFGFIGMATEIASGRYLLTLLYFLPFIVELRNAGNIAILPLAMLGSSAICNLIVPGLDHIFKSPDEPGHSNGYKTKSLIGGSLFISIYLLSAMNFHSVHLANQHVSRLNREAMEWLRINSPENSKFLVLTGVNDPIRDWTSEWFPALTDHVSLTTVQGREWIKGDDFISVIRNYQGLQSCLITGNPLGCILEETLRLGLEIDYIYIAKVLTDSPALSAPQVGSLLFQLKQSDYFISIYDTTAVAIFENSDRLK